MRLHDELEEAIAAVRAAIHDTAGMTRRDRAIVWLLAHAELAYPRIIELLEKHPGPGDAGLADILPQFGRGESIAVLVKMVRTRDAHTSELAARALRRHPR